MPGFPVEKPRAWSRGRMRSGAGSTARRRWATCLDHTHSDSRRPRVANAEPLVPSTPAPRRPSVRPAPPTSRMHAVTPSAVANDTSSVLKHTRTCAPHAPLPATPPRADPARTSSHASDWANRERRPAPHRSPALASTRCGRAGSVGRGGGRSWPCRGSDREVLAGPHAGFGGLSVCASGGGVAG